MGKIRVEVVSGPLGRRDGWRSLALHQGSRRAASSDGGSQTRVSVALGQRSSGPGGNARPQDKSRPHWIPRWCAPRPGVPSPADVPLDCVDPGTETVGHLYRQSLHWLGLVRRHCDSTKAYGYAVSRQVASPMFSLAPARIPPSAVHTLNERLAKVRTWIRRSSTGRAGTGFPALDQNNRCLVAMESRYGCLEKNRPELRKGLPSTEFAELRLTVPSGRPDLNLSENDRIACTRASIVRRMMSRVSTGGRCPVRRRFRAHAAAPVCRHRRRKTSDNADRCGRADAGSRTRLAGGRQVAIPQRGIRRALVR